MLTDEYLARFGGIGRLYGRDQLIKLSTAHVLIVGLGGVGSWLAESLARTGVGSITMVDLDDLCVTNINRQVHALNSTVGQFKVEVMEKRLLDINPELKINLKSCYFNEKNLESIFDQKYDYVIDACDDFTNKSLMIEHCFHQKIPLITIGAAGGKTDPTQIRVSDLTETQNDRMIARIKKKLRKEKGFPLEGKFNIWCVFSHERAMYPGEDGCPTYKPPGHAKYLNCDEGFGSASFVTGAFAFVASSHVIGQLTKR